MFTAKYLQLLATITILLNGPCVLVDGSIVTCVKPDVPFVKQIFSISVHKTILGPVIPILRKNICIHDSPLVDISIGTHAFNLLNATVSTSACRDLDRKLICQDMKLDFPDECHYANLVMFAAVESIVGCESDADCVGNELPPLWCEWTLEISKHVCHTPFNERLLNACEVDANRATRIRGACVFTNSFCAYIVENVRFLLVFFRDSHDTLVKFSFDDLNTFCRHNAANIRENKKRATASLKRSEIVPTQVGCVSLLIFIIISILQIR